jgi:hypothetical protein
MNPPPEPLPDRIVILGLLVTLMVCFALVFWSVRLAPGPKQSPLQWRELPATPTSKRPLI